MVSDGENALYTPAVGGARSIRVIFTVAYQELDLLAGGVETTLPVARCRAADVMGIKNKEKIEIRGVTYYVRSVQPDGAGLVRLLLSTDQPNS